MVMPRMSSESRLTLRPALPQRRRGCQPGRTHYHGESSTVDSLISVVRSNPVGEADLVTWGVA